MLALICLVWGGLVAANTPAYVHASWGVHDGLPVNSIMQLARARDGYLWLATLDGLVRFDGAQFRTYNSGNTPGFRHGRLTGIVETRDGRLLLSSDAGVVQLFDPVSETCEVLTTLPTTPRLWTEGNGETWIGLWPGLGRIEGAQIVPENVASLATLKIVALHGDGSDRKLIATDAEGIWSWQGDTLQQLATAAQLPVGVVAALDVDAEGVIWVGGSEGLARIDRDGVHAFAQDGHTWRGDVQSLQREVDGSLLLGTETGPLRLRGARLHALDPQDPRRAPLQRRMILADSPLRASASAVFRGDEALFRLDDPVGTRIVQALPDRDGVVWLATVGAGLHRLRPAVFDVVGVAEGLSAREVYPLHQDGEGAIWIGTQRGGLNRWHDGRVDRFGSEAGLLDDNIHAIASDADGALWVATREAGLFRRDRAGGFHAQALPQQGGARVRALMLDRDGALWAGGEHGLSRRSRDGHWQRDPANGMLAGCDIRTIRQAPDAALWLATNRCGVARIANGQVQRYDSGETELSDFVRDILIVDAGTVWIASEDRGIARLRLGAEREPATAVSVRAAHGLLSDGIHQILDDGHGWWWMSTNQGVFRVRREALWALADRLQAATPGDAPLRIGIEAYAEAAGLRDREANGGVQSTALRARRPTVVRDPGRRRRGRSRSASAAARGAADDRGHRQR